LKDKKMDRVVRQLVNWVSPGLFLSSVNARWLARNLARAAYRQERWRKICIDALKQSGAAT